MKLKQIEIIEEALRHLHALCVTNVKIRKRVKVCEQKMKEIKEILNDLQSV